ncbi:unnamed protein product, partial [Musa hybrid cultivar]
EGPGSRHEGGRPSVVRICRLIQVERGDMGEEHCQVPDILG